MLNPTDLIQEFKKRQSHAHNQYVPGNAPGWDQLSFHKSEDRYRMVFGGNQSGKSYTAAYEIACWLRGRHPHRRIPDPPTQVWCISAEYATLEEGVYRHLLGAGEESLLPPWEIKNIGSKVRWTHRRRDRGGHGHVPSLGGPHLEASQGVAPPRDP